MTSQDVLVIILIIVSLAVVFAIRYILAQSQKDKFVNNFQKLAQAFQFDYIPPRRFYSNLKKGEVKGYPSVDGMLLERHVRVHIKCIDHSNEIPKYTCISMACANLSYTIFLSNEVFFDQLNKAFGSQDIQTGDKDFDKKFIIKGNNEQLIKKLFDTATKQLLIKYRSSLDWKLTIYKNEIYYEEKYIMDHDENYKRTIELIKMIEKIAQRAEEVQRIYA